jgi:DNA-binding HxlR family transcriptional regulator
MTNQAYGQFCGLSRAMEVICEPWALLVIRDLVMAPKRFEELHDGLPGISASVLAARLSELGNAGVVRCTQPESGEAMVYELTEYGSELEDIVLRLGLWGAKKLGGARRDEIVTTDSMLMALRATFRPEAARGMRVSYELHIGDIIIHARVNDGALTVGVGALDDADLIIEAGPALKGLMAGEVSPRDALETDGLRIKTGNVRLTVDPGLLAWFAEIFHVPPAPVSRPAGNAGTAGVRVPIQPRIDPIPAGVSG